SLYDLTPSKPKLIESFHSMPGDATPALSRDGKLLAFAGFATGLIRLKEESAPGKFRDLVALPGQHERPLTTLTYSDDGKTFFLGITGHPISHVRLGAVADSAVKERAVIAADRLGFISFQHAALFADGKKLMIANHTGPSRVLDLTEGESAAWAD